MTEYVELIEDTNDFKAGTQFKVTHSDDGFWSLNHFFAGKILVKGKERRISVEADMCKRIYGEQYTAKVIINPNPFTFPKQEWWEMFP